MMNEKSTYLSWLQKIPLTDSELGSCSCPNCDSVGLAHQYLGFADNDYGWKLVWCESCNTGIQISRTKIPSGEKTIVDERKQKEFLDMHSHINLIL